MNSQDPYLPPGCTDKDINKHFGDPTPDKECSECGEMFVSDPMKDSEKLCEVCRTLSPCCGVEFDEDIRICPECKEHI